MDAGGQRLKSDGQRTFIDEVFTGCSDHALRALRQTQWKLPRSNITLHVVQEDEGRHLEDRETLKIKRQADEDRKTKGRRDRD